MAILVRFLISLYEVPSSALLAELTHDYDERTSMFGYRYFFGWTGGLSMTMLGFGVFFHASPRFPQGQLDPANYPANALTACIVMVVAIFVSAFGTQKFLGAPRQETEPPGNPHGNVGVDEEPVIPGRYIDGTIQLHGSRRSDQPLRPTVLERAQP